MVSPHVTYLLAVLAGLTIGVWADAFLFKREKTTKPLEQIRGVVFTNEVVDVDGKSFIQCTFNNVKLRHAGGPFLLRGNNFSGPPVIHPVGDVLTRYTELLIGLDKIKGGIISPDGEIIPNVKVITGDKG